MLLRYDIRVRKPVTVAPKFKAIFGRTEVPYGRYVFRFHSKQIGKERLVQLLLKQHKDIKADLKVLDLGVES